MGRIQRAGTILNMLGNGLCLTSAACSAGITLASILGILERASDQERIRLVFLILYLVLLSGSMVCTGEYVAIKLAHRSTLLKLFGNKTLSTIQKSERTLRRTGFVLLAVPFALNLLAAGAIWGGDGHGLAGTWLFEVGGTPIVLSFAAMIPVRIQGAAWKMLLKKTGKWSDGPYE